MLVSWRMPDTRFERRLLVIRLVRSLSIWGLAGPVLITATLVIIHRLTNRSLSFLVDGSPWTHWFWNTVIYSFFAGAAAAFLARGFVCPACGEGFHVRKGYHPRHMHDGKIKGWGVNAFSSRCVNCGQPLRP